MKEKFDKPFKRELAQTISNTSHICSVVLSEYRKQNDSMNEYQMRLLIKDHVSLLIDKTNEIEGEKPSRNTDIVSRTVSYTHLTLPTKRIV